MCAFTSLGMNVAKNAMVSYVLTCSGMYLAWYIKYLPIDTANDGWRKYFKMSLFYKKGTVTEKKDFLLRNLNSATSLFLYPKFLLDF